jgi:hypothetical protein
VEPLAKYGVDSRHNCRFDFGFDSRTGNNGGGRGNFALSLDGQTFQMKPTVLPLKGIPRKPQRGILLLPTSKVVPFKAGRPYVPGQKLNKYKVTT